MKTSKYFLILLVVILSSCNLSNVIREITVENKLDFTRNQETVSIDLDKIFAESSEVDPDNLAIISSEGKTIVSQLSDTDGDGKADAILFQPEVAANSIEKYRLVGSAPPTDSSNISTYSRFVPERTDDYAWENDKVAFRTYGPEAQRLTEEGLPGGTLSSGIDCWLKKVDYPIINKWYEGNTKGDSYHEDRGEGLDNFHVGVSRGCGGTGIWDEENKALITSKNYVSYKQFAAGPIRNFFELDYAPYEANGKAVKETKQISIDLGSNFSKYEIAVDGAEVLTIGLTLHEKDGTVSADQESGWFSYWQPHFDSELGTAIIVAPELVVGYFEHKVDEADLSHLMVHVKVVNGKATFYSGFAWKESGQYVTAIEWEVYLGKFAQQLSAPLAVTVQ